MRTLLLSRPCAASSGCSVGTNTPCRPPRRRVTPCRATAHTCGGLSGGVIASASQWSSSPATATTVSTSNGDQQGLWAAHHVVLCARADRVGAELRPAPDTFADPIDEGALVMVAVPAQGLYGGRAGPGPLRHGAAGRAPIGVPVRVRAPVPARVAPLGPALWLVLPRLPPTVGRHVEQAQGCVGRLVAAAGRGVGEENAVAVAQVADDVPFLGEEGRLHVAHRV